MGRENDTGLNLRKTIRLEMGNSITVLINYGIETLTCQDNKICSSQEQYTFNLIIVIA